MALAKGFAKWAGENAEFQFKLGIVDGKLLNVEEVKALATMPGKEELFAKLLFLINAPAQRLATVINATGRDLAVVIEPGRGEGKVCRGVAASAVPAAAAPSEVAPPAPASEVPAAEPAAISEVPAPAARERNFRPRGSETPAAGSDV